MITIVPMAGKGKRFADRGYLLPKPLIPVSGKPMILRAVERLPKSEKIIFVVRKEHEEEFRLGEFLRREVPNAEVMVEENPVGQAGTSACAVRTLPPEEEVFIAACDNSFLYDEDRFVALKSEADAVIWTFTKNELLREKPEAWGWLRLEKDEKTIEDVSVKIPVSDNPYNDHAIVASFYFKSAKNFLAGYDAMVRAEARVNNEFYVDSMPAFYRAMGKKSVIFDVDLYVGWGKPEDLYAYEEREYRYRVFGEAEVKTGADAAWKKFFDTMA